MKRLLPLVFLCAPLFAAPGDLYVVERSDAGGSSVTLVKGNDNRGVLGFDKMGAMATVPGAIYGVAPSPGVPLVEAHLVQSVSTPMAQSAQAFQFVMGMLPQRTRQWQGVVPVAMAAYALNEVLAFDTVKNAFVILRPNDFEYASSDDFLQLGHTPHDITLARISKDEIMMLSQDGATAPRVGFPADYTLRRIQFYQPGKADIVTSYTGLKKVVGTSALLSPGGAFYVSADIYGQFLAHQDILTVTNQSAHLKRFSYPHGSTMVPLGHGFNHDVHMLEVQMGDDLWVLDANAQNGKPVALGLFSRVLGSATVRGNSHGPAHHRVLAVSPTLQVMNLPYLKTVVGPMTQAAATAKAAVTTMKQTVAARFKEMWQDIHKTNVFGEVGTAELTMLLNFHPGASEWLHDLLMALSPDDRTALGIQKGYNFHPIVAGSTLKLDLLYEKVAALADCGAILAKKP